MPSYIRFILYAGYTAGDGQNSGLRPRKLVLSTYYNGALVDLTDDSPVSVLSLLVTFFVIPFSNPIVYITIYGVLLLL